MPGSLKLFPKGQRGKIEEGGPVLSFKSGRYDVNLIKDRFAERLANMATKVKVPK